MCLYVTGDIDLTANMRPILLANHSRPKQSQTDLIRHANIDHPSPSSSTVLIQLVESIGSTVNLLWRARKPIRQPVGYKIMLTVMKAVLL